VILEFINVYCICKENDEMMNETSFSGNKDVLLCRSWSGLTAEDVTEQYKEPFILTLYRKPGLSVLQSVGSIFQGNNEVVNFWSHFLPLLGLLSYFYYSCTDCLQNDGTIDPYFFPLVTGMGSISLYHVMSCTAHIFCSMSPKIRHICFFLDYGAISVFSFGTAVAIRFYMLPRPTGIQLFDSKLFFLCVNAFASVLAAVLCCATRHRWKESKYIIRTIAFVFPFFAGNLHIMYRAVSCCFLVSRECHPSLIAASNCWIFYFFGALFNASRIPERWYPKKFDFIGQSHHWFHILTSLGTLEMYRATLMEAKHRWTTVGEVEDTMIAVWWVGGTFIAVFAAVVFFAVQVEENGHLKSVKRS
jgi:predicted membrane channel-forming protein YqfA (hemolysin III family)